ncbi:MAG: hypothetical protein M0Z42_19820 [Actinomycetota bacterium]|nr:hypothetical protein [Actinomycetota bacterium]
MACLVTVASGATTPPSVPASPYVTLQPPSPRGGIPGAATDTWDLHGMLGAARPRRR